MKDEEVQRFLTVLRFVNSDSGPTQTDPIFVHLVDNLSRRRNSYFVDENFRCLGRYLEADIFSEKLSGGLKGFYNVLEDKWWDIKLNMNDTMFFFTPQIAKTYNSMRKAESIEPTSNQEYLRDLLQLVASLQLLKKWQESSGKNSLPFRDFVYKDLRYKPIFILHRVKSSASPEENSRQLYDPQKNIVRLELLECFEDEPLQKMKSCLEKWIDSQLVCESYLSGSAESEPAERFMNHLQRCYESVNAVTQELGIPSINSPKYHILKKQVDQLIKELNAHKVLEQEIDSGSLASFLVSTSLYLREWEYNYYFPSNLVEGKRSTGYSLFYKEQMPSEAERLVLLRTVFNLEASRPTLLMYEERAKRSALRSTIALILGRVNAHDLGHVLTRAELPGNDNEERKEYFKHLTGYLRTRMVFAAEAAAAEPNWVMSLPFRSQVIYPFAHFKVGLKLLVSPVCRHIAQSEGVNAIKVSVRLDRKALEYSRDDSENTWRCKPHDIYVSVPTGLVGAHALYCILENVIRNGAKYGNHKSNELNLKVCLDTKNFERSPELIRARVWDDHSTYNPKQFARICQFFPPNCLPKWVPVKTANEGQWCIIDDVSQPVSGGWGIKEMRITAAWLRKEPIVNALMQENTIVPPLLRPIWVKANGEEVKKIPNEGNDNSVYMGYEFYLLKAKEALIIDPELETPNEQTRINLQMKGVDLSPDLSQALTKTIRHNVCIVKLPPDPKQCQEWWQMISDRRNELPSVLIIVPSTASSIEKKEPVDWVQLDMNSYSALKTELFNPDALPITLLEAYQKWIKEVLSPPKNLTLLLHLNPTNTQFAPQDVASAWKETAERFKEKFQQQDWKMVTHAGIGSSNATNSQMVVYDYHQVWAGIGAARMEQAYFYEPCGQTQPAQIVLFNPPDDPYVRLRTALGLIEAGVANIAIVDERIWEKREDEVDREGSLSCALQRRRIFIPDQLPTQKNTESLIQWLKEKNIKILAIHQGMLDKMFDMGNDNIVDTKKNIEDWIGKVKKTVPFVVVESDRGEGFLPNLPSNARFVPFSALELWVFPSGPSKYHLVQTLLASTRGD